MNLEHIQYIAKALAAFVLAFAVLFVPDVLSDPDRSALLFKALEAAGLALAPAAGAYAIRNGPKPKAKP